MEKYWVMSNIDIYKILCPHKIEKHGSCDGKTYRRGELIYLKDEYNRNIYFVTKGKVKLVNYGEDGSEIVRHIIEKGQLFGENLILGEISHDEFAIASSNKTKITDLNVSILQELMGEDEYLSYNVYKSIAYRIKKLNRRLDLLVGKDVTSRVIAFIHDMHEERETLTICNPLTQKEIACLLATSRESVARVFNDLKEKGIIEYDRKKIFIKDVQTLRAMSGA